jgi:hypothetical protein
MAPFAVHGESLSQQLVEAAIGAMVSESHCSDDLSEPLALALLT